MFCTDFCFPGATCPFHYSKSFGTIFLPLNPVYNLKSSTVASAVDIENSKTHDVAMGHMSCTFTLLHRAAKQH